MPGPSRIIPQPKAFEPLESHIEINVQRNWLKSIESKSFLSDIKEQFFSKCQIKSSSLIQNIYIIQYHLDHILTGHPVFG